MVVTEIKSYALSERGAEALRQMLHPSRKERKAQEIEERYFKTRKTDPPKEG